MRRHALAARRRVCGYTQEQMADALMVATSTVRRWEAGTASPQPWQCPRICRLLDIAPGELSVLLGVGASDYRDQGSPSAGIPEVEVSPVDRRNFNFMGVAALAGMTTAVSSTASATPSRRIGRSDVERYGRRVTELRRLDDLQGGGTVYPLAMDEIGKLSRLATAGSFTQAVERDLLSTLGELFQFASWTAFDAGKLPESKELAQFAATAANRAGNKTLAATALSELSYLTASGDDPGEAVNMARASLANAGSGVLPVVRVVLADRLAWACARTGDASGVDRACGIAEDAHDRRDDQIEEEPDTVYWINRDESAIMAGRCWAELHHPKRSVPILEHLTAPYDETHAREMALYSGWLAGSYVDAGEVEAATESAQRAVSLSHRTSSPRTDAMLRGVLAQFEPHCHRSDVRDLLESASV